MPSRKPADEIGATRRAKCKIAGVECELAPVTARDWFALHGKMKQDAIDALAAHPRSINPMVMARALAQISQTIYDDSDVLNALANPRYAAFVVERAMKNAGCDAKVDLDSAPASDLYNAAVQVLFLSGVAEPNIEGDKSENPTNQRTGDE